MTMRAGVPTIAVLMHDGFYSYGTGAGRSNEAFLQVLISQLRPGVRLIVLPIHLTADSREYNQRWHLHMQALIKPVDGQVVPVDNGTGSLVRFGRLPNFQRACTSAAAHLQRLHPTPGRLLIIAFDCPFYGLAAQLPPHLRASLVSVARSTAALHTPQDAARITWERQGLHDSVTAGGRVAAISAHMRAHLERDYLIPVTAILDLPNGLIPTDWHVPIPNISLLPAKARSGFLFSVGRAAPYKGFDDLLTALPILRERRIRVPHTVLAAVSHDPALNHYQRHLQQRITAERLNVTLLPHFELDHRSLFAHPAMAALIVPSRVEPFGRIPLEAFVAGSGSIVATTAGGLAELVTEQTGYQAQPGNPDSLADAIQAALTASPEQRAMLRAAGRALGASSYNYPKTVGSFLANVAPWATRCVAQSS